MSAKEHPDVEDNDYEFTIIIDPITGDNSYIYTKGDQQKIDSSCYDRTRTDVKIIPKVDVI